VTFKRERLEKGRLIDASAVPRKTMLGRTSDWIRILKSIPKGQAMVWNEKDLGIKTGAVQEAVRRYMKLGLLPREYRVVKRTTNVWDSGDSVMIYIIHEKEEVSERARA
jgi:predicted transcriptional regulator